MSFCMFLGMEIPLEHVIMCYNEPIRRFGPYYEQNDGICCETNVDKCSHIHNISTLICLNQLMINDQFCFDITGE